MTEGFLTDIRTAELFFRICRRYKIKDLEKRLWTMRELTRRKKARYLRDVQPFLENKKVLGIGFKRNAEKESK
jgi:hypothetical protein